MSAEAEVLPPAELAIQALVLVLDIVSSVIGMAALAVAVLGSLDDQRRRKV